ncbi:MAG: response regulator [Thermoplasmatota archaeon]
MTQPTSHDDPIAARIGAAAMLIVDDEPEVRSAMVELLATALPHVAVRSAASGAEGLDELARGHIDLILSDYVMPGMDGLQFLARARTVAPNARRILVTAVADMDVAIRAINEEHIEAFLQKPVRLKILADTIANVMRTSRRSELVAAAFRNAEARAAPIEPNPGPPRAT